MNNERQMRRLFGAMALLAIFAWGVLTIVRRRYPSAMARAMLKMTSVAIARRAKTVSMA